METITDRLPIMEEIQLALTSQSGPHSSFLTAVTSYEKGQQGTYLKALKHIRVLKCIILRLPV